MTNNQDKRMEIAPGVYFVHRMGRYYLAIETPTMGEILCWDFEEVSKDPISWFSTMKAVALATQKGPSIAYDWVKSRLENLDSPSGSMVCNICSSKFIANNNHPFIFSANLNGKRYYDLQCSLDCNNKRRTQVYAAELGADFIKTWNDRFMKKVIQT